MQLKSFLLIPMVAAALIPAASASVIFSIVPITTVAFQGDTNDSFEVLLTNTAGSGSTSVAAFSFGVTTTDTDITFASADMSTPSPYIFAGDSFDADNSFALNTSMGASLEASDLTNDFTGITIAGGQSVALGRVLYDVSSSATPGSFTVTFTSGSGDNSLSDADFDPITIDTLQSSGPIPIDAVPEPASLLLVPVALLGLMKMKSSRKYGA